MVARAGYSRFCYCREVGGRTTKLAEPDDNRVRYCQVRNIISGKLERLAGLAVGVEGGLSKVEGGCRGLYAFAVPDKWTHA